MKTKIVGLLLLLYAPFSHAQKSDSIKTHVLSEIIVQGVKTEGDTLQNFYRSNAAATTESILSRMKGITLIRRGAYGQEPVFRGMSNGQLNITLDGMKIFGACTDKMDPVTIYVEPVNLSGIQALMGPQGSAFGSTIGGALNMKLAQPAIGPPGARGQVGFDLQSSAKAINHFSALNISKKTSAYRASATWRKNNNYHAGGGHEVLYSQYEKINVAASGKWAIGKFDTLGADVLFDLGWNIGFPALPMDVGRATAGIYSLTYHRVAPWGVFHNLTAKAYHNKIAHSMDDTHRKDVPMHMDMPGESTTSGFFAEGDVHIFHKHRTIVKAEYFTNKLLGEMTMYPEEGVPMYMQTAPETRRQNAGLYIRQQFRIDNANKLEFSFRADLVTDHLADGTGRQQWQVFMPSLPSTSARLLKTATANYRRNLTSTLQWEIQGGYGERAPTLNERYGFYLFNRFDGYDYLGNPTIKNERSWNAETSLNYFGRKLEFQASPFYQRIYDYMTGRLEPGLSTMTIGAKGVKKQINMAWADLAGIDLMLLASPLPSLQWITTIKYTYGVFASDEALPLIPPLKSVTALRYQFKKADVQAEWDWSAAQRHVSHSSGEQKTPAYTVFTVRAGWKINQTWQLNGGVENILDNRYRDHLDWGGIPRPGRNVYANVIYKFSTQ
jgi:iron complex outermembrane recepter protein